MNMNAEISLKDFQKHIISIRKTVEENISIASSLLPAHVLLACNTVPVKFGIGKGNLIKIPPTYLGNIKAEEQEYIK